MLQCRCVHVVAMLSRAVLLAALFVLPGAVMAACPPNATVLVSCDLKNGAKRLETCLLGDRALYRYGTPGKPPELEMLRHVRDVDMTPWPGVSRTIWEGFTFFNEDIGYEVYHSIDKDPDAGPIRGGITVMRGDETLATLECDPGTVDSAGYSLPLYEAKEAAGQCWDFNSFKWTGEC